MNEYNSISNKDYSQPSVTTSGPIYDYMTGRDQNCVATCPAPAKLNQDPPMSIRELNRVQDELIEKNYAMAVTILEVMIGKVDPRKIDCDRSSMEMNFRTNNAVLIETNGVLSRIIDILGIQ